MTVPSPLIQYKNEDPWSAVRGSKFTLQTPQMQPDGLVSGRRVNGAVQNDGLRCGICIEPKLPNTVTSTCLERVATVNGRSEPWPEEFYCDIVGDFGINEHFRIPFGSAIAVYGHTLAECPFGTGTNGGYGTVNTGNGLGGFSVPANGEWPPNMVCFDRYWWTAAFIANNPARSHENIFFPGDISLHCCSNGRLMQGLRFFGLGEFPDPVNAMCDFASFGTSSYEINAGGLVSPSDWDAIDISYDTQIVWRQLFVLPSIEGSVNVHIYE